MPEGFVHTGSRFASDLRRIREARGITIEDLHAETKIPRGLLESFEETGLFDHPMFNRVYLRSFVRTYAEVAGIAPEAALASLEEALRGTYRGGLGTAYLQEDVPYTTPEAAEEQAGAGRRSAAAPEQGVSLEPPERPTAEVDTVAAAPAAEAAPHARPTRPAPSPPPRPRAARQRSPVRERSSGQWAYIGIGVVVLGLVIWLLARQLSTPAPAVQQGAVADTAVVAADTTAAPEAPPPAAPRVVLGDTMHVAIVAARGPVQNIRVRVDDDLRRPYWIEEGASRTFPVASRIVIEQQLDRIALEVDGHDYPFRDRIDDEGRVVLTKEEAQAFFDAIASR